MAPTALDDLLRHGLWTDDAAARDRLAAMQAAGAVDGALAAGLSNFIEDGWTRLAQAIPARLLERAWADLDAALARGDELPCHREGVGVFGSREAQRLGLEPGRYAVHDLHNRSVAALQAVSHPGVMDAAVGLLGPAPVLMQSQWLRHGSAKGTHADYVYYPIDQPLATLTVWVAVDPVDDDNGPLYGVPGSHRLAPHRFDGGQLLWPHGEDVQRMQQYHDALDAACAARGLGRVPVRAAPGDAVLMHPRLAHGACPARQPRRTRRSLVLHLAAATAYRGDHRPLPGGSCLRTAGALTYHQPAHLEVAGAAVGHEMSSG